LYLEEDQDMQLAVITGATGLVGANLAVALLKLGNVRIRCTKRHTSSIKNLSEYKEIEWVYGDLNDADSLIEAFKGADVVFHCAASVATYERLPTKELIEGNIGGTTKVIEAVKKNAVKRLIYCSSVVAIGMSENGIDSTEDAVWNLEKYGLNDGYATTKYQAELIVMEAAKKGEIDAVIVNPAYMIGPFGSITTSPGILVAIAKGEIPGISSGMMNFVDVRDVCNGMILAWQKGRCGERYILGGFNLRWKEFIPMAAKIIGVNPPTWEIPKLLAMAIGWFGEFKQTVTGKEDKLSISRMRWAFATNNSFSSKKAETELGYTIAPIETAIQDAIDWFKKEGTLPNKV